MDGSSGDEYEAPVENRRRAIAAIFAVVFVDLPALDILVPVVPLYAESSEAGEFVVGPLLASCSVTRFALASVLGRRLPVAVRRRRPGDGLVLVVLVVALRECRRGRRTGAGPGPSQEPFPATGRGRSVLRAWRSRARGPRAQAASRRTRAPFPGEVESLAERT